MKNEFIKNKLKEQRKATQGVQNRPAEKKKGVTYYIALCILFFCLIGSSFGFIYAFKDMLNGCSVAHADENVEYTYFVGSDLPFYWRSYETNNASNVITNTSFSYHFAFNNSFYIDNIVNTEFIVYAPYPTNFYYEDGTNSYALTRDTSLPLSFNVRVSMPFSNYYCFCYRDLIIDNFSNIVGFEYYTYNGNISTELGVNLPTPLYGNSWGNGTYLLIRYFDKDNNSIYFGSKSSMTLSRRVYYFDNGSNIGTGTYRDGYSVGYNDGFTAGLNDNQTNIFQDGYNSGLSTGDSQGYNRGYAKGLEDANNNSFLALTGAVLDAPVRVFLTGVDGSGGLINFDFLGFNMATFFMSLITLAIIIFVVKLFLGGK